MTDKRIRGKTRERLNERTQSKVDSSQNRRRLLIERWSNPWQNIPKAVQLGKTDLTPSSGINVTAMGMLNTKMFCHCIASLLLALFCESMMLEGSYEKNFCWQESNLGPHSHEATYLCVQCVINKSAIATGIIASVEPYFSSLNSFCVTCHSQLKVGGITRGPPPPVFRRLSYPPPPSLKTSLIFSRFLSQLRKKRWSTGSLEKNWTKKTFQNWTFCIFLQFKIGMRGTRKFFFFSI